MLGSAKRRVAQVTTVIKRRLFREGAFPDFIIIGAQRSGTTSLFDYIMQSPQARPPVRKEIHFFDRYSLPPIEWYKAHFPDRRLLTRENCITGEATPFYLFYPDAADRIAATGMRPKLIAILRRPEERALSHYQHEKRKRRERLSFGNALDAEADRLRSTVDRVLDEDHHKALKRYSYKSRGFYFRQIQRFRRQLGDDCLLLLTLDELKRVPGEVLNKACSFLNIKMPAVPHFEVLNRGETACSFDSSLAVLADEFSEDIFRLIQLLPEAGEWLEE